MKKAIVGVVVILLLTVNTLYAFAGNDSYTDSTTVAWVFRDEKSGWIFYDYTFITEHNQRYTAATANVIDWGGIAHPQTASGPGQWAIASWESTTGNTHHNHRLY